MINSFFSKLSDSSFVQFSKLDSIIDGNLHPEVLIIKKGYLL